MINIKIISVGSFKEKYLVDMKNEYFKRISKYASISEIILPDESNKVDEKVVKEIETKRIIDHLKDSDFNILLSIEGNQLDSVNFAKKIDEIATYKTNNITFIIGGSYGVSSMIKEHINYELSFSKMTFPHQLMKCILAEQIYRAFTILSGTKYHK